MSFFVVEILCKSKVLNGGTEPERQKRRIVSVKMWRRERCGPRLQEWR